MARRKGQSDETDFGKLLLQAFLVFAVVAAGAFVGRWLWTQHVIAQVDSAVQGMSEAAARSNERAADQRVTVPNQPPLISHNVYYVGYRACERFLLRIQVVRTGFVGAGVTHRDVMRGYVETRVPPTRGLGPGDVGSAWRDALACVDLFDDWLLARGRS